MDFAQILGKSFQFNLGNLNISTSYVQAGVIIVLLFLLVLSLASFRRHLLGWSIKGAFFGLFFGFLLALIFEGLLIVGGRTAITELVGWKNAPKPIQTVLDAGRNKLVQVLGVSQEIPSSVAKENPTVEDAINIFQSLDPSESSKVRQMICEP
ncbi:hypothetical protein HY503_00215 [Candidatus Woesebacteria bacterium]|nr:hypothetical protein [Candidatus Woesebacteria bacterium]